MPGKVREGCALFGSNFIKNYSPLQKTHIFYSAPLANGSLTRLYLCRLSHGYNVLMPGFAYVSLSHPF